MKKLTKEDFIEKARKVHGNKYDYSKVNYVNAQTKVCIICPEHGEFWQKPYNHLGGNGCPNCIRNNWTTESFIKKAKEIHGDKYDYSKAEYNGVRDKVCIICNDLDRFGNKIGEFWQLPLEHLSGHGCERERRGNKENCWEVRVCPICGKEFNVRKKHNKITCSEECRRKYVEIHKDEINKIKGEKLKEKYSKKSKEDIIKEHEKTKKTCLERYGVESYSQTEEGRNKSSETMKRLKHKWDEEYKINVLMPKYKEICENDDLELLEFRNRFDCDVKCKKCGNVFTVHTLGYLNDKTIRKRCRVCYPNEQVLGPTIFEDEFGEFLSSLNVKFYKNCRSIITPQEIDYYLPDYKIGFELDGIYWHSEVQKPNDYHIKKTEECKKKGIRLIHIFEDEWINKKEICKSRVKNVLGKTEITLYARKCNIKLVSKTESKIFIDKNHLQGNTIFKYAYGLYFDNELVSIMTFGKLRKSLGNKDKKNSFELIRFCNKINVNVIGAASKLLKHFIKEHKPNEIVSYADKRWSIGNMYEKIGFKLDHISLPNYSYVINGRRVNRFALRKNILMEKYGCPKEVTERDFCLSQRWYRIYDCGCNVYKLLIK